jgi:hypothetical protein
MNKKISQKTKEGMAKIPPQKKIQMYLKRDSCDGRRWLNKNGKHIRVKYNEISKFLREGWVEGRLMKRSPTGHFIKRG